MEARIRFNAGVELAEARDQRDRARVERESARVEAAVLKAERDAAEEVLALVERWYYGHDLLSEMLAKVQSRLKVVRTRQQVKGD